MGSALRYLEKDIPSECRVLLDYSERSVKQIKAAVVIIERVKADLVKRAGYETDTTSFLAQAIEILKGR